MKIWKGKMLKKGKSADVCRHRCSKENPVKRSNESHCVGWKLFILSFHRVLSAPAMSADVSQVGVTLFWILFHCRWFVKVLSPRYFSLKDNLTIKREREAIVHPTLPYIFTFILFLLTKNFVGVNFCVTQ